MAHKRPTQLNGITDLTLIAEIKPGLIDGIFDSRSYAWRLRRVLELLDAARRAGREADLGPNPFVDGVARLRGIHFFRFAILPDDKQLLLNVTFDGGWEPYMRLIWGPLGTMLDLIFCHCKGYPLAAASSYDNYIAWVRRNEVPSQFFYADAAGSAADRSYLNQLEALQRSTGGRPGADLRAAQLALQPLRQPQPGAAAVNSALRSLKGLFGLTQFFGFPPVPAAAPTAPPPPGDDGSVLLRFAQDFLPDLRDWFAQGYFDPGQQFDTLRQRFERERKWLMSPRWNRPRKRDREELPVPEQLQAGILQTPKAPPGRFVRGAVVLVRVTDGGMARDWLESNSTPGKSGNKGCLISDGSTLELAEGRVVCTVAITFPGLRALGVHEHHLAAMPAEFAQGMEARAGILGDVRINHPQQWHRPPARDTGSGARPAPIDFSLVHLVIQLRTCESAGESSGESECESADEAWGDRSALLPRLNQWIGDNLSCRAIDVLAVEPAWSRPGADKEPAARDHFGYVDGISQPTLSPSAGKMFWDDAVKSGELLLGRVNDRGDGPLETPDGQPALPLWQELGTFLVLRKIRQYVDRFDGIVDAAANALRTADGSMPPTEVRELVRAKLMGRGSNGDTLIRQRGMGVNDFDYRHDTDGAQCPFASHVRRANPRTAMAPGRPPRITRRGMAYGPPSDKPNKAGRDEDARGVLFMAYNASIAEQFEVIQRWLTGGNSSGVPSSQPDPLLGVPRTGEPAVFRFVHGEQVLRVDLGDQPVCRLEWGIYAFVPPMALLRDLKALVADPCPAAGGSQTTREPSAALGSKPMLASLKKRVKEEFEDDIDRRRERWKTVRVEKSGVEKIGTSVMVGSYETVMQVLRDPGSTYSAAGYGERMTETLGHSPFGQDDVGPERGHERDFVGAVKQAVANAVSEPQAYAVAHRFTEKYLARQLAGAKAMGLPGAPVDIIELGTDLIAELCMLWFGVDYGDKGVAERGFIDRAATRVRCPGHLLAVARHVFSADPNTTVQPLAKAQGAALKAAAAVWVRDAAAAPSAAVLNAVLKAIDGAPSAKGLGKDERNGTVANVMLGMPATLLGTWSKLLIRWSESRELWRLQHEMSLPPGTSALHAHASAVLRESLIRTMAEDPVADGIWRTVKQPHLFRGVDVENGDVVWLGLGSALAGLPEAQRMAMAEDLLFGGAWQPGATDGPPHACPGRGLAIGVLLGALAALLLAGQWATTASPTTLSLQPPPR